MVTTFLAYRIRSVSFLDTRKARRCLGELHCLRHLSSCLNLPSLETSKDNMLAQGTRRQGGQGKRQELGAKPEPELGLRLRSTDLNQRLKR